MKLTARLTLGYKHLGSKLVGVTIAIDLPMMMMTIMVKVMMFGNCRQYLFLLSYN